MKKAKLSEWLVSWMRYLGRTWLSGAVLVGVCGNAADAQECNPDDWAVRDAAVCATDVSQLDRYPNNRARERGTVGSLFRWSSTVTESELAQPFDDEPLITDRPDFTEASSVVGLGVLQIEVGYTHAVDNDGVNHTVGHSYPETLFRYGVLANWLEFRLAMNYPAESINGIRSMGAEDLYFGFKIGLTPQAGWRPEMSLVPQMTIPTGGQAFTNDEVLPGLNWLYGWDINDFISTAGSTQFNKSIDELSIDNYTELAQSWTIGYSLTERLGGYTEYFGLYPSGADSARVEHYFDGGLTYKITNDIQIDIRGGKGLNDAADDYFVGSGLSIRCR